MTSLQRPNGVTTSYSYDNVNRLTRMLHSGGQGQAIEDFRFGYNAGGEVVSIASLGAAQLLPASKSVGTADAANRITQFDASSVVFDNEGQTTSKTDAQGATNYQWDARGRLTRASLPGGQSVDYSYDPLGRRASRTAAGGTTSFLYDGADVVLDRNSDGSTVDYLNGAGVDDKLRQSSSGSGGPLYFLQDHLGSTTALLDSNGNITERQQYDAFGGRAGSSATRYGYTGREHDSSTGLIYYRSRWYDPGQGRFITEDPIGMAGGLNHYSYAGNSPINHVDPFGRSWSTFKQGLVQGGIEGFWEGVKWGAIFGALAALAAATGGTVLPAITSLLAMYLGAEAARSLAEQVVSLIFDEMCDDELHYRIGALIGSFVGALVGGLVGGAVAAGGVSLAARGVRAMRGVPPPEPGVPNGTPEGTFNRGTFRKGTLEEAEAGAPRDSAGRMICETCGKNIQDPIEVNTKNGPVQRRGYDLDHYPETWAERVQEMKQAESPPTRKQVLDEYNKDVRPLCPGCNTGHTWEGVPGPFRSRP